MQQPGKVARKGAKTRHDPILTHQAISLLGLNPSVLPLRLGVFARNSLPQRKYCPPTNAGGPGDLGVNQACTRAHVGEASSGALALFVRIKGAAIVLYSQYKIALRRRRDNHFYLSGACMAANVVMGFLCDK